MRALIPSSRSFSCKVSIVFYEYAPDYDGFSFAMKAVRKTDAVFNLDGCWRAKGYLFDLLAVVDLAGFLVLIEQL